MNYLFANWKMYGNKSYLEEYIDEINNYFKYNDKKLEKKIKFGLFVPNPYLYLASIFNRSLESMINIGAQDASANDASINNARTGEVDFAMLKDVGCDLVIIGHSERRKYHNEDDNIIKQKLILANQQNLNIVYCIGESLEKRTNNQFLEFINSQLLILKNLKLKNLIIAYEPIWAIGTGKIPTNDDIDEVVGFIRSNYSNDAKILYGGSVNAKNIQHLKLTQVDGFLVGNASRSISDTKLLLDNLC